MTKQEEALVRMILSTVQTYLNKYRDLKEGDLVDVYYYNACLWYLIGMRDASLLNEQYDLHTRIDKLVAGVVGFQNQMRLERRIRL